MGLEIVEFVMAVEEAFGIAILDSEAQEAITPGKLADLVMSKVGTTDRTPCLSSRAFYRLRQSATNELEIPRKLLKPDTPLSEIVPKQNRRDAWEKLKRGIGASAWPQLRRPESMVALFALLVIVLSAAATFFVTWIWKSPILTPLTAVTIAILASWASVTATRPLRTAFPPGYMNLGDLARFVVARNPGLLQSGEPTWTRERVWCVLRALIVEHFGVTDFTEDSRFVQDMHIDE